MRLPIGASDVTPSGGTVTLIGRRAEGWQQVGPRMSLEEALALAEQRQHAEAEQAGDREQDRSAVRPLLHHHGEEAEDGEGCGKSARREGIGRHAGTVRPAPHSPVKGMGRI